MIIEYYKSTYFNYEKNSNYFNCNGSSIFHDFRTKRYNS